ncbi:PhzF family phenazine biosynthesis protein [Yoonia litorea]|uniref:Trans-2,3-dihydro-3-hydroxyanthranilate isomerase n=1 Tax=Yoonia litorea TaxID=1123755 RepID=A0A1I6M9S3_9RHOB|nr:PhzF family phenazine biosynthesis protein [Yoonia litorea]SFS12474.1 trans-2,3-dihydro-3-hydroxyanthranilate isomerase [Yoonia litorea]
MTKFFVYDVFTNEPFAGNQLGVVPDAANIPEEHLQKIAREFNFSETTFVYPPEDHTHTARVRIFTPTMEIPFAGHPTIGTAIALNDEGHEGDLVLELGVGPIPCTLDAGGASFTVAAPLEHFGAPEPELVAQALSLNADAINSETHAPVKAGVGLDFVIAELKTKSDLEACQINVSAFREGAARFPSGLDFAIFAYVRNGSQIDARMFAPLDDILEDPATGSACAALAALLTETLGADLSLQILQGEAMGRPSHIQARTTASQPVAVTISGQAVRAMEGQFTF